MSKACVGKVFNPESKRYVKIGGPTHKKLIQNGILKDICVDNADSVNEDNDSVPDSVPDSITNFAPDKKSIIRTVKSVIKKIAEEKEKEKEKTLLSLKTIVDMILRKINEKLDKTESNIEGWTVYSIRDYISSLVMSDCSVPDKLEIEKEIIDYKKIKSKGIVTTKYHIEYIYKIIKKKYKVSGYTKNDHFDALYDTIKDRYNITVI